jgi:tetratricopeptide (TPR) repeat protein
VAQKPNLDSLELVLNKSSLNDSIPHQVFDQLITEYVLVDREKALRYARQYHSLTSEKGDSLRFLHSGSKLVIALFYNELYDSCQILNAYLLPLAKRLKSNRHINYLTSARGTVHAYQGEYESALVHLSKALELRKADGDPSYISLSLNNLGLVYYKMKAYQKALDFINESISLKEQHQDHFDYDIALTNAALCHVHLGNYSEANQLFEKAIAGGQMSPFSEAMVYYGRGIIAYNLGRYDIAKNEFWKSFQIGQIINDFRTQADNLLFIGKIDFLQGNTDAGFSNLLKVEQVAEQFKYREMLISVIEELILNYEILGDLDRLVYYQDKYILLKNEVYNARVTEQMATTEVRLKRLENEETLARQKQMVNLSKQVLRSQNLVIIAIAVLTIMAVFAVILIRRKSKVEKRLNKILAIRIKNRVRNLEQLLDDELHECQQQKILFELEAKQLASKLATLKGIEYVIKVGNGNNEFWLKRLIEDLENSLVESKAKINELERMS